MAIPEGESGFYPVHIRVTPTVSVASGRPTCSVHTVNCLVCNLSYILSKMQIIQLFVCIYIFIL